MGSVELCWSGYKFHLPGKIYPAHTYLVVGWFQEHAARKRIPVLSKPVHNICKGLTPNRIMVRICTRRDWPDYQYGVWTLGARSHDHRPQCHMYSTVLYETMETAILSYLFLIHEDGLGIVNCWSGRAILCFVREGGDWWRINRWQCETHLPWHEALYSGIHLSYSGCQHPTS